MMEFVECPHCGKDVRMDALLQCVRPIGAEDTEDLARWCVSQEFGCMCPSCDKEFKLYFAGRVEYMMMEWNRDGMRCGRDLYRAGIDDAF